MITKVGLFYDPRKAKPWIVRWFGYSAEDARGRRYSRSFKLKRDAEDYQASVQAEFNGGGQRDRRVISVKQLCDKYMEIQKHRLRPSSMIGYNNTIPQLVAFLGPDTPVDKVTREKAEQFLATRVIINEDHKRKGKPLSAASRNQHHRLARAIFAKAVDWEYIKRNPFAKMRQGKVDAKPWHFITPDEFAALLAVTPDFRTQVLYGVMYGTGLRYGEAINLLWNGRDVNFEHGQVNVTHRPPTDDMPGFYVKGYETRSVSMPKWLVDMLVKLQEQAQEGCPFVFLTLERWERVRASWRKLVASHTMDKWFNSDLANNSLRKFKLYCKKAGVTTSDKLNIHCLRKSFAMNLANVGTPQPTLKKLMGHASIATTEEYYLRSSDANEQRARQALERMIGAKLSDAGVTPEPQKRKNGGKKKVSDTSQVSET